MTSRTAFAAALFLGALCAAPACSARDRTSATRVSTAMDFLAALGKLDFAGAGAFLDDDASLDLPFAGQGMMVSGRENVLQFFRRSMAKSVGAIAYTLERAYPSPEADAVVLELSTQARTAGGQPYANRLVAIVAFRGRKIALFREYFNPVPLTR